MSEIISAAVLLILIMDPLGNLPIFMSVLKHTEPKRRRAIMIRELLIALLVMFIFLFAGEKILAFLNLRAETVSISGGIILFLIAIKMIFPSAEGSSSGLPAGEEPQVIESIQALVDKGTKVLVCGTCLNFYGLTEKLAVGGVTNMYVIAEKMLNAGNVVKP